MQDKTAILGNSADMIVSGYAFTKDGDLLRVLNLSAPSRALVLNKAGEVLETNMDDIELEIVTDIYKRNKQYLEDSVYA